MRWITSLWTSLPLWNLVERLSLFAVLFGVIGENIADKFRWPKEKRLRRLFHNLSAAVLVIGLAVEFLATSRTIKISGFEIASLSERTADANRRAEESRAISSLATDGAEKAKLAAAVAIQGAETAKQRAAEASLRATGAEVLAGSAEAKAGAMGPRMKTDAEWSELSARLKQFDPQSLDVFVIANSAETDKFAEHLIAALDAGNWTLRAFLVAPNGVSARGLSMIIRSDAGPQIEQSAKVLESSLSQIGIVVGREGQFSKDEKVPIEFSPPRPELPAIRFIDPKYWNPKNAAAIRIIVGDNEIGFDLPQAVYDRSEQP